MSPDTPDPSPDAAPPVIAFCGYRLYPVYLRITDAERAEVIALWQDAQAFQDPSVAENRKLMRAGIKRYLARHGYEYLGRGPRGLDLWLAPFD